MVTSWRERERLERSYWPRDKCTLCKLPDCEECPIYTDEYGQLEQEYHTWLEDEDSGTPQMSRNPDPDVGKNRDMEATESG